MTGAPRGELSERRTVTSRIYDGAEASYWIYANPGVDAARGAPVMVWLDASFYLGATDALGTRLQTVTDNLVHRGLIPPLVHVLLAAGDGGTRRPPMSAYHTGFYDFRILQFDEVTDEFGRYLLEEVLPDVERVVPLRQDGYSRAIAGISSGGTCTFKVGWFAPEAFSRLHPICASFTAWGWRPGDGIDGGHMLPLRVRGEPRKNLRVWLTTGAYDEFDGVDLANWPPELAAAVPRAGSQLLGNLELAQALKVQGYDFRFRLGATGHDMVQTGLDLPEALPWLWRGYDPERTFELYEPDEAERNAPAFRFGVLNRPTA
jgi:enterochelin esterase family protein